MTTVTLVHALRINYGQNMAAIYVNFANYAHIQIYIGKILLC